MKRFHAIIIVGLAWVSHTVHAQAVDCRVLLYMTASKLQWYDARVNTTMDENDVIANMLLHEPDGFITIFEYATPKAAEQAFDSTAQGETTAFKEYPARQVDQFDSSYFMWQDDALIYSISRAEGDPKEWAEYLLISLKEMLNPVPFLSPEETKTPDTPPDQKKNPPPASRAAVGTVSTKSKAMHAELQLQDLPPNTVIMAELEHLRSGHVLEKVPVIVLPGGTQSIRFKEPILGWNPGAYEIRMLHDSKTIATKKITIDNGRLVHE